MRCYLDTNIFLRFFIVEDERTHQSCRTLFKLIEERKIKAVTSSLVLAEIVWVLGSFYKVSRAKISDILTLVEKSNISIDNRFDNAIAIQHYAAHQVKFVDALIASNPSVRTGRAALVSYDRDFDKLGIQRVEPRDVIQKWIRNAKP